MSRWRITVVAVLVAVPLLTFAGAGTFYLWWHGWSLIVWWPMMALFGLESGVEAGCREALAAAQDMSKRMQQLKALGIAENTLVVISGDHGPPGFPRGFKF